jgi:hypothetical protein
VLLPTLLFVSLLFVSLLFVSLLFVSLASWLPEILDSGPAWETTPSPVTLTRRPRQFTSVPGELDRK